jgi:hypothetical protein
MQITQIGHCIAGTDHRHAAVIQPKPSAPFDVTTIDWIVCGYCGQSRAESFQFLAKSRHFD